MKSLHKGPSLMISMTPVHKLTAAYQLERVKEAAAAVGRAVHLLKCICNNWFSEKGQKISLDNETTASFADVKELYESEKGSILTPTALTQFAVNPSRLQLQNVQYVLKVLNDKVTAEQPLCASLLSHESWLKKSGYPKTPKSKARRKEPKKLEESSSKDAENAGAVAADEPWDASQEETDYSDVEDLGLQKTAKSTANMGHDSQTSDEEHEAQANQPDPSVCSPVTRPRVHFSRNKSKGGLSLELCTGGVSSVGSASAEATCLSSSNCDNLPKKRSLADARTGGASDSDSVIATSKSRRPKSLKIKLANTCEDSHDEAINDYYDERDTECDDEEVDEDDDNEDREGEKDEDGKVKIEALEAKDGEVAAAEPVIPVQPLSVRVAAIRAGWTLASVGRLTVGELFVMLGRKNPLLLEYEFENFKKELPALDLEKNSSPCSLAQPLKETLKTEVSDIPNLKINIKSGISATIVSTTPAACTVPSVTTTTSDLSGMLSQLLELSQQLFHKNSMLDSSTKLCPCRLSKGLKSSVGGGSSRSSRMTVLSARSPDAYASPAAPPVERTKPSSAKRLIASDDTDPLPAAVSSKRHCTRSSDAGTTSAYSSGATDSRTDVTSVAASRPTVLLTSQAKLEAEISALPRYCQRYKSRLSARKNVVVQRQLPLLPKQPPGPPVLLPARPRPLQPKPTLLNLNNCNIGTNKNLYVALPGAPNISLKIGCPTLIAPANNTQLSTTQSVSAISQPVQNIYSNVRIRSVVPTPTSTIPMVTTVATKSNSIPTPYVGNDSYSSKNNPKVTLSSPVTISLPTVSPSENSRQGPRYSFPSLRWAASDHPNIIVGAPLEGLTSQEVLNAPAASKPISETSRQHAVGAAVPFSSAKISSYSEKSLPKLETGDNGDCSLSDILNLNTTNDSLNSSFLESLCCSAVSEGITLHSSDMEGVTTQTTIGSADLPATSINLSVTVPTHVGENARIFTLSTPQGGFSPASQNFSNMSDLNTPKHESEGYRSTKAPSPESNTLDANVSFGVPCKDKINIVISDPIRSGNTTFDGDSSDLFSPTRMENTSSVLSKGSTRLPVSSVATKVLPSVTSTDVNVLLHPSLAPQPQANNVQLPTQTSVDMLSISLDLSNSSSGFSNLLSSVVGAACPVPEQESSLLNTPPRPKVAPLPPTARPCTPSSPSRFVPRDDWMTGAVGDFSLTGLFDSIDPPLKVAVEDTPVPPDPQHGGGVGSRPPLPQSASLLSVLNENGVDFTAKFDALTSSRNADSSH
ncbi:hypothetical protein FHG87_004659 [Trinorchestia longiramus]|nr:hypothetical protein FHG87_004659 [Trinorchestia longiramus]